MNIRLTVDARDDLRGIRSFMAEHGDALVAETIIGRIGTLTSVLAKFPHIGHTGHIPGTFEILVPRLPFVIVYRIDFSDDGDQLIVLRVFHTSRKR